MRSFTISKIKFPIIIIMSIRIQYWHAFLWVTLIQLKRKKCLGWGPQEPCRDFPLLLEGHLAGMVIGKSVGLSHFKQCFPLKNKNTGLHLLFKITFPMFTKLNAFLFLETCKLKKNRRSK